jgi:hypothetical protein
MTGFGGGGGGGGFSGGPSGYPPSDLRGQGGWNRESYELPNEAESQAKYAAEVDREEAGLTRPGPLERFKRWFSARF